MKRPRGHYESSHDEPSLADLTTMVRELHLENRQLGDQLAEWKLEIEELHNDLCSFCRGLSAKLKRLYKATGQEELYYAQ
jgi:predicted RNase H-like nuclease (RuvC/YqgF family)